MKAFIKRLMPIIFSLVVVATATVSPLTAGAATVTIPGDGLKYTFDESTGVFTVTGNGDMYDFRDTDWFNNKKTPWSGIKDKIKTVVIEEGVTGIGEYAFYNCKNLTTVKLSSTVKSIRGSGVTGGYVPSNQASYGAFRDCVSLKNIEFPEGLETIGKVAFRGCTSLESVVLPNSLVSIGDGAFINCSSLASVTIGDNLTQLSTECFYNCDKLANIKWGKSLKKINDWSLFNTRFVHLEIPQEIESIGVRSLANCYFLESVVVNNAQCEFKEIVNYNDPFNNSGTSTNTKLKICGHTGSTAQTVAEKYGYQFVSIDNCKHENTTTVIETPATCDTDGVEALYCNDCETVLKRTAIPATGHDYKETKSVDETSKNGHILSYQTCEKCGGERIVPTHQETENSTALSKKYVWVGDNYTYTCNATCVRAGWETYTCTYNGCTATERNYVQKAGHTVAKWTVVTKPTCTEVGKRTGHCSVCNKDVEEEIPALGHTYDEANPDKTIDNSATDGHITKHYTCSVCKQSFKKVEHVAWVEGSYTPNVITQPKCVIDGLERDTCDICGETRNVTLPANGQHEWEQTGVVNPTCTTKGRTNYKCKNCGLTKSDNVVEALGHDYQKVPDKCVAATCTQAGSDFYICAREGCSSTDKRTVEALGHEVKRGTYNEITAPTCDKEGKYTATCERCGIDYEAVKPALGHDFQDVDVPLDNMPGHVLSTPTCTRCKETQPAVQKHKVWLDDYYTRKNVSDGTCTMSGKALDTCTLCGEKRTVNTTPALGHEFRFVRIKERETAGASTFAGGLPNLPNVPNLPNIPNLKDFKAPEYSVTYYCKHCGTLVYKKPSELYTMWMPSYFHTSSEVRTAQSDASYLDVNGDRFINSKDYALIYNLNKAQLAYEKELEGNAKNNPA